MVVVSFVSVLICTERVRVTALHRGEKLNDHAVLKYGRP
jgi:hypothetical protein